jgi:DNA-binding NarL/FixJ family response regulator
MEPRSERRKKIIEMRANGVSTRKIAQELGITFNNVCATIGAMRKLGYLSKIEPEETRDRAKQYFASIKKTDPTLIIELNQKGLSRKAIAEKLNEKLGYVVKVLQKLKLPSLKRQQTAQFRKQLIELYNAGRTYKELVEILQRPIGRIAVEVHRLVNKNKLQLR